MGGDSYRLHIHRPTFVRPPRFDQLQNQMRSEGFTRPVRIDGRPMAREGRFEVAFSFASTVTPENFGTFRPASDAQDRGGILERTAVRVAHLRPFAAIEGQQIGNGRQLAKRVRSVAAISCRRCQNSQRSPVFRKHSMHQCIWKRSRDDDRGSIVAEEIFRPQRSMAASKSDGQLVAAGAAGHDNRRICLSNVDERDGPMVDAVLCDDLSNPGRERIARLRECRNKLTAECSGVSGPHAAQVFESFDGRNRTVQASGQDVIGRRQPPRRTCGAFQLRDGERSAIGADDFQAIDGVRREMPVAAQIDRSIADRPSDSHDEIEIGGAEDQGGEIRASHPISSPETRDFPDRPGHKFGGNLSRLRLS